MKPIAARIAARIAEFSALHPDLDATIVWQQMQPANKGRGPGWCVYTVLDCGIGFEEPLSLWHREAGDERTAPESAAPTP